MQTITNVFSKIAAQIGIADTACSRTLNIRHRRVGDGTLVGIVCVGLVVLIGVALADIDSIGPNGINSAATGLTGEGIAIGMVESGRPGKPGFDDSAKVNPNVVPTKVFEIDFDVLKNKEIADHAEYVASAMISTGEKTGTGKMETKGVAPKAMLYASAIGRFGIAKEIFTVLAIQHVAKQNGMDVRAINMSFGIPTTADKLNGASLPTLAVDWSARVHNTLYVLARGNDQNKTPTTPNDNFNGLNVGGTQFPWVNGNRIPQWSAVSPENADFKAADGRVIPDVVAPGNIIRVDQLGEEGWFVTGFGTSIAAPHVTGAAAIIHQLRDQESKAQNPRFGAASKQHEVTKVVLMNSADKLVDDGTVEINGVKMPKGFLLEMEKTITAPPPNLRELGYNWLKSPAYDNPDMPKDPYMGVGAVNANRAIKQFKPGQYGANDEFIPAIAWDYGETLGEATENGYKFATPLAKGSFISITLCWDRLITKTNVTGDPTTWKPPTNYKDPKTGDQFKDEGFSNLDLYLMPAGERDLAKAVAKSTSTKYSVKHIFFQIPETKKYEIWVRHTKGVAKQKYALAWWAVGKPD